MNHLVAPCLGLPTDQVSPGRRSRTSWRWLPGALGGGVLDRAPGRRGRDAGCSRRDRLRGRARLRGRGHQPVAAAGARRPAVLDLRADSDLPVASSRPAAHGARRLVHRGHRWIRSGFSSHASRGLEMPPLASLIWTYLPNYICAVLAVLPSKIIAHLGRKVSRARQLGSYRLVELIGRGGMGEVWKAEHRLLARPAAIKLIAGHGADGRDRDGSPSSAFAARRRPPPGLRSPHTIQLYDFGVTRDRRLYYVMELLEGMRPRDAGRTLRPPAACAGGLHPAAGLPVAGGGPRRRAGPPRHQAGQPPHRPGRAGVRLREGARLRPGEARRHAGWEATCG